TDQLGAFWFAKNKEVRRRARRQIPIEKIDGDPGLASQSLIHDLNSPGGWFFSSFHPHLPIGFFFSEHQMMVGLAGNVDPADYGRTFQTVNQCRVWVSAEERRQRELNVALLEAIHDLIEIGTRRDLSVELRSRGEDVRVALVVIEVEPLMLGIDVNTQLVWARQGDLISCIERED